MRKMFFALVVATMALASCPTANAQFNLDDVIVHEFFDDILQINQGSVVDLHDILENDNITRIAIADPGTAYVVNFTEIWRVTLGASSVELLAPVEGVSPAEITMDINGDLLVASASNGIERVDTTTGDISLVFDQTFFNPTDICVSQEGYIYATEFFDGLGRVNQNGTWTKLGDWPTNFFNHLDIGPDGYLYATTTFEDGDVYRINPTSGAGVKIGEDVYAFIDDIQVANDGTVYIAGARDTDNDDLVEDMVLSMDPTSSYAITIVVDENQVGDPNPPFFNPMDIEIFDATFYEAAPAELAAETYVITRGVHGSGDIDSLMDADNSDLVVRRNASDFQARAEIIVSAISPMMTPTSLEFDLEASVFARAQVVQSIALFNFETNSFELVDSRTARRFSDLRITAVPSGDLARFVDSSTGEIQALVSFESVNRRQLFSANIDQVLWRIQ